MVFRKTARLLIILVIFTGCTIGGQSNDPEVGSIVPIGQPEIRDLSPTTETVPNCSGGNTLVTKHPSMTVATSYAIEWEIGGEVGVGVTIGEGVVPGGVNLEGALNGATSNGLDSSIEQSSAWDLSAEPNKIHEYTIMWREVWQPGYVNIILPTGENKQVNVVYRSGIQSDIIGDKLLNCDGRQVFEESLPDNEPAPIPTALSGDDSTTTNSPITAACTDTGSIPPLPLAPPKGCILILEWWIPPSTDGSNCGILITENEPSSISADAIGTWWFVSPNRPDTHLEGFQAKNPHCGVQDLRE